MIDTIKEAVIAKFSDNDSRLNHIIGVVDTARKLAEAYNQDQESAMIAAWFHDYTKYDPIDEQIRYIDLKYVKKYADIPSVYHGFAAAALLELRFDVTDNEIKNAVRYHTNGRAKMTMLDKIVFIADKIEPNRCYDGVNLLRELAYSDIDLAIYKFIESHLDYLEKNHKRPAEDQLELYEQLKEQISERH